MDNIQFLIVEKKNNNMPAVQFGFAVNGENILDRKPNTKTTRLNPFLCDAQLLYQDSEVPLNNGNFRFRLKEWFPGVVCPEIVFSVQSKHVFIQWDPPVFEYEDDMAYVCSSGSVKIPKEVFIEAYLGFRTQLWEIQSQQKVHSKPYVVHALTL